MAIRAVPVPAYVTNTVDDHAHILRDCGARAAIVAGAKLAETVAAAAVQVGGLDLHGHPGRGGGGLRGRRRVMPWAGADRRSVAAGRYRARGRGDPAGGAGLPDLHLRHRRRAARGDAAAPLHPVQLPRRGGADPSAASGAGGRVSVLPADRAQLRTHGRHVLPARPRGGDRSMRAGSNIWRRSADDPPDPDGRGAAGAGGDARARAGPGRASASRGGGRCSIARWPVGLHAAGRGAARPGRAAGRPAARSAGAGQGARPVRRADQGDHVGRRHGWIRRWGGSSSPSACRSCRATARPRPGR